jgi:hypothetical protein
MVWVELFYTQGDLWEVEQGWIGRESVVILRSLEVSEATCILKSHAEFPGPWLLRCPNYRG